MNIRRTMASASLLVGFVLASASPTQALDEVPAYAPTWIGAEIAAAHAGTTYSTAVSLNEGGDAVGWVLVNGDMRAFVYTPEAGAVVLPLIGADPSGSAADISERNGAGEVVIVGATKSSTYEEPGRAAIWIYDAVTGAVLESKEIGTLSGDASSLATAVSPDGKTVIGYSYNSLPYRSEAMVYDVALDALAPLDFPTTPYDINGVGEIVGGHYVRDASGTVIDLGAPPDHQLPTLVAINDLGWTAGTATAFHTDGHGRFVNAAVRHTLDWEVLWEISAFDSASDINLHGDVVGSIGVSGLIYPLLRIEALGRTFAVQELLAPGYRDQGVSAAGEINDAGQIAGSGSGGAMILTSTGPMPVPSAPESLTAEPHEPTWQQPWNAITLNWSDSSDLDNGFHVERSLAGANAWTEIKADWPNLQLWDMDVAVGVTYDYRVRSKGVAGFSDYSNIATATAPSEPVDRTAPTVNILAPADGAEVSGNVSIAFETTDNKALNFVEVSTTINSMSVDLCSYSVAGDTSFSGTCNWRTRKLSPGTYPIYLYASDALGNWNRTQISVTLVEDSGGGGGCHPKKGC